MKYNHFKLHTILYKTRDNLEQYPQLKMFTSIFPKTYTTFFFLFMSDSCFTLRMEGESGYLL